ncbi:MAG TPA: biotin/lipoyl-containing protein [Gemmata sp.]|nr:biotin/lipoyl-containing protein [Gemmata sp.]
MSDEKRDTPRPFDVRTVEYLLKLMTEHDLAEVDLKEGDQRIRLRKGAAIPPAFLPTPSPYVHAAPMPAPASHLSNTPPPANSSPSPPPAVPAKKYHKIISETPGIFYTRPAPDKSEFVKVGDKVTPETVVCLIEAMKVHNPIVAECTGTIVEVVAKNADPVEFGTILFRVDTDISVDSDS